MPASCLRLTLISLTYAGADTSGAGTSEEDKGLRDEARLDVIATTMATEFFLRDELFGKPGR